MRTALGLLLTIVLTCNSAPPLAQQPPVAAAGAAHFPVSVWYAGGRARAPMLEPVTPESRRVWREDLQKIKGLGFNTVRTWIEWTAGEPRPGEYHFEQLELMLELAEEAGLKVMVQVYVDSAPDCVGEKFPDSRFVAQSGDAVPSQAAPGYCFDHPGVRQAVLDFYQEAARRAKKSPAFFGWDLWSEPHVINWATPTYMSNPEFCFCPNTLERFRGWLRKKYGTLEALNEAWYRRYTAWSEVEPNRLSTILSYTDYIDWKLFIQDKLGEDLRARYEAVKRAAPDRVATSHAAGVGLFSSPHWWEGQSDDWIMKAQVDYYGTSFYPKHSAFVDRPVEWRAALLDFARSFGYEGSGRGFWIGELQGGFGTIALNVSSTVTPADLRIWTWSALARGAKGICYYAWYPMSSGYESGGFGLIQLDGGVTERARAAGEIARLVDSNQALFLGVRPPRAQVAIVYNPLAHFVGGRQRQAAYGGPQGEVAGIERDSLLGIHRALFPTNVPLDFIHINHLSQDLLRQYRLVLLPYPLMLPEKAAWQIREYVQAGGALVAEARLGWNNERGRAAETIPGLSLDEVMGCREVAVETAPKGRTALRWATDAVPGIAPGDLLPGRWYVETLEPAGPQARVAARFASGAPAAILSTFGRGKTLMLGSYVSAAYQSQPEPAVERFYAALLGWAGVELPVSVAGAPAEVRYLESGPDKLVFVFHHQRQPAELTVGLRVAGEYSGLDLVTGKPVEFTRGKMSRRLAPDEVWVVKLSPK